MMPAMFRFRHLLFALLLPLALQAQAADPAKTLFGIELGTRFTIPPCGRGEEAMARSHCYSEAQNARTPWGTDERHVHYPRTEPAPYARGELVVELFDGMIEVIHVNTWGIEGQGPALDALTRKYGPPTRSRTEKIKAHRARIPSLFAEWDFRDFSLRLQGTTTTIDWGRITLATRRHSQRLAEHAAKR